LIKRSEKTDEEREKQIYYACVFSVSAVSLSL
jgi:hypothetical protein